jgi:hypothetical protein
MADGIKYKNIIGTGLTDYVQTQINYRKNITSKKTRDTKDLQWLTNRNSWLRLSSGAEIYNSDLTSVEFQGQSTDIEGISPNFVIETGTINPTLDLNYTPPESTRNIPIKEDLLKSGYSIDINFDDNLAKKYILQGGTLKDGKRRSTFSDTYSKGNYNKDNEFLGSESSIKGIKDDLGYKPFPGITNVSVGTRGKWRTTLEADIEFTCYNLEQLEIMNKLYMSLGVHVFLEWGHTPYINSQGNIIESFNPIDFFDNKFRSKKLLIQEIENQKKEHHGNYGALLGRVYNFNISSNIDGSYNCKIQVVGAGAILESIRVNRASRYDFDSTTKENESSKYSSDLENVLISIQNVLSKINISQNIKTGTYGRDTSAQNTLGVTDGRNFIQNIIGIPDSSYGNLLNNVYNKCTYNGYNFSLTESPIVEYPNDFAKYGNAWQYISSIGGTDNLQPLPIDFFYGYATRFSKGTSQTTSILQDTLNYEYIKFGHLLALIQHLCIFNESNGNITITNSSNSKSTSPVVYIDYHPDNTIIKTGVIEASIDPGICLIPLSVNPKAGETPIIAFDKFFSGLDTLKEGGYGWEGDVKTGNDNISKNLIHRPELNKVNKTLGKSFEGKLMNVLINLKFAASTLKNLESNSSNKEVDLLSYINEILDGINLSLGKINNFRAFYDDNSNVVRIIDEHKTQDSIKELLTIPNFGLGSIAYDYSFSSNIDPKTAAKIVIATGGENGGIKDFAEDVLTYQQLNKNVRDRFAQIIHPSLPAPNNFYEETLTALKSSQKLFDQIFYVYSLGQILDENTTANIINAYQDASNTNQKYYKDKATTLLIPLDISLKIDGITGILPYNAFLLPDNRLPLRYQGKVAFIIFSIDHEFENNQWNTILKGQIIYRNNPSNIIDARTVSDNAKNPPKFTPPTQTTPESTTYGGSLDLPFTEVDFTQPASSTKAQPEITDTTPTNNVNPITGETNPDLPTGTIPLPQQNTSDIINARNFITTPGLENTIQSKYKAYLDLDYTSPSGKTLRIGFGSDTITTPGGSVRRVKEGDEITLNEAYADLERRLRTEFKPKVISTCQANGVNYDSLPPVVKTVFIDCAYNYGSLWNDIVISYRDGDVQGLIQELQRRIDRGASQVPLRRAAEIRHLGGTPRL